MTQELEQAVISYARVLSLAPHHTESRMSLASLYSQLGMTEEALALLDAGGCGLWVCEVGVALVFEVIFSYINCTCGFGNGCIINVVNSIERCINVGVVIVSLLWVWSPLFR